MADYNIAMGVKPPEPINYLGQAAQMMALRAAQDDLQGNEAVKQFYAQGGDTSTPEARARLKSLNPKFGMAAEKAQFDAQKTQAEIKKLEFDNIEKAFAQSREFLNGIDYTAPDAGEKMKAWHFANHKNPYLGPLLASRGIDPAQSLASIDAAIAKGPEGIRDALRRYSMGQDKYQAELMSRERGESVARIGAGPGWAQANLAREKWNDEQQRGEVIPGEGQFLRKDRFGNLTPIDQYGPQFGPNAPVDQQSAGVLRNNLAGAASAGAPVNAMLTGGQPPQAPAAGPTVAAAAQLAAPQSRPMPPARAGYQRDAQGREVKIPQVGMPEGVRLGVDERWNDATKQVELVPGSKTYLATQNKQAADREAARKVAEATSWGTERVQRLLSPENKNGLENQFGGYSAYITRLFSGDTATVGAELSSLKSDMKNAGLQVIRAGGSIGALTEKEWPIVEGLIDSLDPKMPVKDAVAVFKRIEAKLGNIAQTAAQTYDDKWGGTQFHKPLQSAGGGASANTVVTPDGMAHSFPNAAAAAAFKKAAGL